jgi:hypothetical protein
MHNGMPSSPCKHLRHFGLLRLLSYWTYNGMPSGPCRHLRHLGHLCYLGTIGNLNPLGTIGNLNTLGTIDNLNTFDPSLLDTALIDSYHGAFIIEMDPKDLCPSEGYYVDNLLNPLPTATPLLLDPHIRWIYAQMGMTQLDLLI